MVQNGQISRYFDIAASLAKNEAALYYGQGTSNGSEGAMAW